MSHRWSRWKLKLFLFTNLVDLADSPLHSRLILHGVTHPRETDMMERSFRATAHPKPHDLNLFLRNVFSPSHRVTMRLFINRTMCHLSNHEVVTDLYPEDLCALKLKAWAPFQMRLSGPISTFYVPEARPLSKLVSSSPTDARKSKRRCWMTSMQLEPNMAARHADGGRSMR